MLAFPVERSAGFPGARFLINAIPAANAGLVEHCVEGRGVLAPGDVLVLCTDAFACYLLTQFERGAGPAALARVMALAADASAHESGGQPFAALIDEWRHSAQSPMRDDDVAVVLVSCGVPFAADPTPGHQWRGPAVGHQWRGPALPPGATDGEDRTAPLAVHVQHESPPPSAAPHDEGPAPAPAPPAGSRRRPPSPAPHDEGTAPAHPSADHTHRLQRTRWAQMSAGRESLVWRVWRDPTSLRLRRALLAAAQRYVRIVRRKLAALLKAVGKPAPTGHRHP